MTAPSLGQRVAIPLDVVSRDLDGEAVLLNLASGAYFGLDRVGTRIWQLLRDHGRLSAVRDAIVDEYDVPPDAATGDLLRFVGELAGEGLVAVADE